MKKKKSSKKKAYKKPNFILWDFDSQCGSHMSTYEEALNMALEFGLHANYELEAKGEKAQKQHFILQDGKSDKMKCMLTVTPEGLLDFMNF